MITEIVLFNLPDGMSREDAIAKYRLSVPGWRANQDLIRKTFLFDETSRQGGAVYNWKSIEAAKLGHGPEAAAWSIRNEKGGADGLRLWGQPSSKADVRRHAWHRGCLRRRHCSRNCLAASHDW